MITFTEKELGTKLAEMYRTAHDKEQVAQIILFGIKYGSVILENNYSVKDIVKASGLNDSYYTEICKGIHLAKYVTVKL